MTRITGSSLVAKSLKAVGVDDVFFLMGGPMTDIERSLAIEHDIRMIDVRHEQAAAMMAHAYSRVSARPGVCMTGAGVDAVNLLTGVTNAYVDCAPLVAVCGSVSLRVRGMGAFQELDQLALMKPVTKCAWQIPTAERIPAFVEMAFRHAVSGRPGPVYLEIPSDVLDSVVEEDGIAASCRPVVVDHPEGDADLVSKAIDVLAAAQRPLVLAGSGVIWSSASAELRAFVEATDIPFYTTPQARGCIPEDHSLCFLGARSLAFREADCVLMVGTRANFVFGHLQPPRFADDMKLIQVNIDGSEIGHNRPADIGIVGDAGAVLRQLTQEAAGKFASGRSEEWIETLRQKDSEKKATVSPQLNSDTKPIHTLRLLREIKDIMPRDAILAVDGHETLNFTRQTISTHCPGHRINVGPSGCIGVGVPFGIGAKVARPDNTVVVLSGDGGFGMNGMEVDTAVRHNLPLVVVVVNNGGWGTGFASPSVLGRQDGVIGRDLGFTRYDKVVEALGGWGELVDEPDQIRPALERAFASGKPALVNVMVDPLTMATTQEFTDMRMS